MKKKLFMILLALAATLTMASCSGNDAYVGNDDDDDDEIASRPSKDDDEKGNSLHTHRFTFTGTGDHNYHEVSCPCGEKKTEVHNYEEGKCSVCESKNYFSYNTTPGAGTCVISGLNECHSVIVIPSVIDGCRVTTLTDYMFSERTNDYDGIKEIVLPDTLTSIGRYAFGSCDELEKINIPAGVTEIGERAFDDCENLTEITIPQSVTTIGDFAFSGCLKLSDFTYQGTIAEWTALGVNIVLTFYETEVTQIHCNNGEHYFGFNYVVNEDGKTCTLTEITIELTKLDIPEYLGGYRVTRIGSDEIGKSIYYYISNPIEEVIIPEGVIEIGNHAFYNFDNLVKVELPDSLRKIGNYAFSGCSSLTELIIPDGVTTIGAAAFNDCGSLETITLPAGITYIGESALANCYELTTIEFKGTVAEWEAIKFEQYWDLEAGDYIVHCIDGIIE